MADEVESGVVIDLGSGITKAGFAGDDLPRCTFPSIIGRPRCHLDAICVGMGQKTIYIGDEAQAKSGIVSLKYPNWNFTQWVDRHGNSSNEGYTCHGYMAYFWPHLFNLELRITPQEHSLLLTEPPLNPKSNREKTVQLMFETMNVPSMYLANSAVLSLYAFGQTMGLIIDSGHTKTAIVPVYDGYALNEATNMLHIGGKDITDYLQKLLIEHGYTIPNRERSILCDIKHKLGYIALDCDME
eukprot:394921_1